MNKFILILVGIFVTGITPTFASPGESVLKCSSNQGEKIELELRRPNVTGLNPPSLQLNLGNNRYRSTPPDEMKSYGITHHNSPLGVVFATFNTRNETGVSPIDISITAKPQTVIARDLQTGKVITWSIESEQSECYDVAARVTFIGILKGTLETDGRKTTTESSIWSDIPPTEMSCELTYDPGSGC
jgi:hypothetical protein